MAMETSVNTGIHYLLNAVVIVGAAVTLVRAILAYARMSKHDVCPIIIGRSLKLVTAICFLSIISATSQVSFASEIRASLSDLSASVSVQVAALAVMYRFCLFIETVTLCRKSCEQFACPLDRRRNSRANQERLQHSILG